MGSTCAGCGASMSAQIVCAACATSYLGAGAPTPSQVVAIAQNATQGDVRPQNGSQAVPPAKGPSAGPWTFGQQVSEHRGKAEYYAGTCKACGRNAVVRYVPRPDSDGTHTCLQCWKAGK